MNAKLKKIIFSEPIKFLKGGVLLKVFSFGLNYILADFLNLNIEITYFFVLVCDFLLGFLINRYFVFTKKQEDSNKKVFGKFIIAGVSFRVLNWLIYVLIIDLYEIYILYAQLFATVFVLFLKFSVYKKIFK